MTFELLCLVVFVLGISINTFIPERVVLVVASIGGIIWAVIQILRVLN